MGCGSSKPVEVDDPNKSILPTQYSKGCGSF